MDPIYEHPWEHLDISYVTPSLPAYHIHPLTRESIQQLQNVAKSNLPFLPSNLFEYSTRLTMVLLDTDTFYSDTLCHHLPSSSPLWIAMLISNTIKISDPNLHKNEHIHPIRPKSLVDYLQPPMIAQLKHFYNKH